MPLCKDPITLPVTEIATRPAPEDTAKMPVWPPVTLAAAMVIPAALAPYSLAQIPRPKPILPSTTPVAVIETTPEPWKLNALIPCSPDTDPAVMAMPDPPFLLLARIPSPAAADTAPLTLIDMAPPPVL